MTSRPRPPLTDLSHLPPAFEFGITTAAHRIEGAAEVGGRGPSIWDVLAAVPGRTVDGSTGPTGIGHHARMPDDLDLLHRAGIDCYRFSVSWSRVQPEGRGPASPAGLDFYERLVDRLLSIGITPWITLYHWDLPLSLMLAGGWLERDTAALAGDYAELVAERLGDRVDRWTTMADPLLHMAYGHALGVDAPGLTLLGGAFAVTHHLLLGHARMREALAGNRNACVGIANHHTVVRPASPADRRAAALYEAYHNGQFIEPLLGGRYPRLLEPLVDALPGVVKDGDLAAISAPLDFYGVDYFSPTTVAAAPDNGTIPFAVVQPGGPLTDSEEPVDAPALTELLVGLGRRHPRLPPLVVTENGASYSDSGRGGEPPGRSPDAARMAYLRSHLSAVDAAVAAGADVRGYFHRGLTDAWEGMEGLTQHYGLVAIEPGTLDRSPRASFDYYREILERHRSRRAGPADAGAPGTGAPGDGDASGVRDVP